MPGGDDRGRHATDGDRYQKLLQRGLSPEKAARIASTDRRSNESRGRPAAYEDWTKAELYAEARDVGIEGRSTMSKGELIEALRYR